jgi:hypothetical protein
MEESRRSTLSSARYGDPDLLSFLGTAKDADGELDTNHIGEAPAKTDAIGFPARTGKRSCGGPVGTCAEPPDLDQSNPARCSKLQHSAMKQLKTLGRRRSLHLSALFASMLSLDGCATASEHLGGSENPLDAQASMTTKDKNHYLAVHDMPPERTEPLLSRAEQARIAGELIAASSRQSPAAAAKKRASNQLALAEWRLDP